MIVTDEKRKKLRKIIDELPNTFIIGKRGTGKGTFMNILLEERGKNSSWKINGSKDNTIDIIREKVSRFARAFDPENMKIMYINEADRLSNAAQEALLQEIEDTEDMTRYFFLANNDRHIIEELQSRCSAQLDLNDPPGVEIFKRLIHILKEEGIKVKNKQSIVDMIQKLYPDIRKMVGTLQFNSMDGVIDQISFTAMDDVFASIFDNMKKGDVELVRKELRSNFIDYSDLYEYLYTQVINDPDLVAKPGDFIILTGEYEYKDKQKAISEINFMAYFFKLMRGKTLGV